MAPLFILMAIAPLFQWQTMLIRNLRKKLSIYLLIAVALAILSPLVAGVKNTLWIFCALTLTLWLILLTLNHGFTWRKWLKPRRLALSQWAMILAHLGIGVTAMGIICSSAYSQQRDVSMRPGDSASVGPYEFRFQKMTEIQGPNYQGLRGEVAVYRDAKLLRILRPEQRYFRVANTATTKAAIDAECFVTLCCDRIVVA